MKKTISINIGGNIFHIEEEGYEKLKSYLDAVHSYFSTFEDSKEIVDDIEYRIAEKFYSQLKKNKEAISAQQVDELIASMGTVADFEAAFDDEPKDQKQESHTSDEGQTKTEETASRKLYRDTQRSVLGGVAAGIAHYFKVDPLWIRLAWIIFLFSGIGFIAYFIFWIVLPENKELEDQRTVKKLFRNPDDRVLGGVSSGIASYFGIDAVVVRLLFVVSLFLGGTGFIAYIILWIITPEAKTVTEKMEMKGEPVTMAGIEKNVKKSLKIEDKDENVFVKILLFPFRLLAMLIEGLSRMLGPVFTFIVEAFRVVFGAAVFLTGFGIMVSLLIALAVFLGLDWDFGGRLSTWDGSPVMDFLSPMSSLAAVSGFFVCFIPALGVALLGLTIMIKKRVGNAYLALTMLAIWIIAVLGVAFTVPKAVAAFRSEDAVDTEIVLQTTKEIPVLRLNDLDWRKYDFGKVDLRLRGHDDTAIVVLVNKESRGFDRKEARERAEAIQYNVVQKGDEIFFDSRFTLPENESFRFQSVDVTVYLPYNMEFKMEQELDEILINTLHINGYYGYQMEGNTWSFDEFGIKCLTCTVERGSRAYQMDSNSRTFDFSDFDEVVVSSAFRVKVYRDDDYVVQLNGTRGNLDHVVIRQTGRQLTIDYDSDSRWGNRSDDVVISLYMPELRSFTASGEVEGSINRFKGESLRISLSGDTDFSADVDIDNLTVDLSGVASLQLFGEADALQTQTSGRSNLDASTLYANDARVSSAGGSRSKVFVNDKLHVSSSGESVVIYRGTSDVEINQSGESRVRKEN